MPKREAPKNPFKPKPRAPKPRAPKPAPAASTSLDRSLPSVRAQALARERERLLREIGRRKRELERLAKKTADTLNASRERLAPVLFRQRQVETEVHALFAELLAPRRLSKPRRRTLVDLYRALQAQGLVDERAARDEEGAGSDREFHGDEDDESRAHGGYSAPRHAAEDGERLSLRALFKRLALALHPDRVQRDEEKASRTEAMKEITRAYERGDLARLLEIEKHWSDFAPLDAVDGVALREAELERTVLELKRQLGVLFGELKALRRSEPYRAAQHLRRVAAAGLDPAELFVAEAERDLSRLSDIRNCLHAFAAGRLTWEDLLSDAPWDDEQSDDPFDADY